LDPLKIDYVRKAGEIFEKVLDELDSEKLKDHASKVYDHVVGRRSVPVMLALAANLVRYARNLCGNDSKCSSVLSAFIIEAAAEVEFNPYDLAAASPIILSAKEFIEEELVDNLLEFSDILVNVDSELRGLDDMEKVRILFMIMSFICDMNREKKNFKYFMAAFTSIVSSMPVSDREVEEIVKDWEKVYGSLRKDLM